MKLVDVNDLSKLVGEPFEKFLSRLDLVCPEPIKAIPIEWINQFVIDTCSSEHDTDFLVFLSWLDKMTEKWRKENEMR